MPLLVACSCGKKLKVRDELIGKKVKCPACGNVLPIRADPEPVEPEVIEESEETVNVSKTSETARGHAPKPPPVPGGKPAPPPVQREPAPEEEAAAAAFWACRREFTNGLLVVTDDALWFGKLADKALKRAKKQLADGESPEEALDEQAVQSRLRFADILEISFNKRHKQIQIAVPGGEDKETSNFYFEDHATRDEVFKDVRRRVGSDWEYQRRDLNRFQAALAPLAVIGILILVFGFLIFLAWAMEQPSDGTRRVRTNIWGVIAFYTVGWLGPWWTGGIGIIAILLTGVWMIVRMSDPPIEISLKPKAEAPKSKGKGDDEDEEEDEVEEDRPRSKSRRRSRRDDDDG